jgi:hypothetical protein
MSQSSSFPSTNNTFTPPVYNSTPVYTPPAPTPEPPAKPRQENEVGEIEIIPKSRMCWPNCGLYVLGT